MKTGDSKVWGPLFDRMLDVRRQLIHAWVDAGRTIEQIATDLTCPAPQVRAILAATVGGPEGDVMLMKGARREPVALTIERIALLRLHQRNLALDEPDPMVPVTSTDLLALIDAAERSARIVRALREKADWQQQHGDDPRDLRNFADSIDPTSEEYDPNQDPLVSR